MFVRLATLILLILSGAGSAFSQETSSAERRKQPADSLDGPPFVTAKGWVIGDGRTGKVLWGSQEETPRAIASTTKMMTAWLVARLSEKDNTVLDQVVTFSERADGTPGSTAGLRAGEQLPVRTLLYGLLLPSGNDAAVAFGEHFGHCFTDAKVPSAGDSLTAFVAEMNRTAAALEMTQTHYLDTNGLSANQSSPRDLLRLAYRVMHSETLRPYVQTRHYECKVMTSDGSSRDVEWKNTNQLLDIEGFDGVKTGTTNAAGACLVSSCHRGEDHLLVVVLGSTSGDARYVDTRNLLRWAWQQRGRQAVHAERVD